MRFNTTGFNPSDEQTQPAEITQPKRVAVPVDINVFSASLKAFETKIEKLKQEFQSLFQERLKVLFDAVPALEAIDLIQYTPYFNDGDTCEFRINSVGFYDEKDFESDYGANFDSPLEQEALKDALTQFIYRNADLMKSLYGDHVKVTITPEETTIEEYEHE